MNKLNILSKLFYLLIHADESVNEKEMALGKKMVMVEELDIAEFEDALQFLEGQDKNNLFNECIEGLLKLSQDQQVNYIAWMSLIANSDGFMDKREWDLLYTIYKKHLNISLDDIMNRQRDLNYIINSKQHVA